MPPPGDVKELGAVSSGTRRTNRVCRHVLRRSTNSSKWSNELMMKTDLRLRRLRSCCACSGLGFLSSGAALGRAVEGLELAAVLRDADVGAAGVEPLAAGPIAAAGADRRRWGRASPHHWGAVDGVVVVPTGPLLLLGLDAVVCASPRRRGRLGTMWKLAVCRWDGSDAVLLWEIV